MLQCLPAISAFGVLSNWILTIGGGQKLYSPPPSKAPTTVSIKVFPISISCWLVFVVSVVDVWVDVYVELA